MHNDGDAQQGWTTALAKVFGAPPSLSTEWQPALRGYLREAGASVIELRTDGPVPMIVFSVAVTGPDALAAAEAIAWRALVRCFPNPTLADARQVKLEVSLLPSAGSAPRPIRWPWQPWLAATLAVWIPGLATLIAGVYLIVRAPTPPAAAAPAAAPDHDTKVHVTIDDQRPDADPAGWRSATERELTARIIQLLQRQAAPCDGGQAAPPRMADNVTARVSKGAATQASRSRQ